MVNQALLTVKRLHPWHCLFFSEVSDGGAPRLANGSGKGARPAKLTGIHACEIDGPDPITHDRSMKSNRRIVIMLTYATAVFLSAKAQAGSTGTTKQIMPAGIYLCPAVMLHFAINWLWGDQTKATGNDVAGNSG